MQNLSRGCQMSASDTTITQWARLRFESCGPLGLSRLTEMPPGCRVFAGGFLPRIVLTFDFDHASRAKGGWSDPARVVHNSPRAGPLRRFDYSRNQSPPVHAGGFFLDWFSLPLNEYQSSYVVIE